MEVWRDGALIGGLYGVALGRAFFGESMFSRADDGSKLAFYYLCRQLQAWDFEINEHCQISSAHLATLGARELPRDSFLARLRVATVQTPRAAPWRFDIAVPDAAAHLPP